MKVPAFLGRILDGDGFARGTCFQFAPRITVTAWHVLVEIGCDEPDAEVEVDALDGSLPAFKAQFIAGDPACDLAVLLTERPLDGSVPGLAASAGVRLRTDGYVMGVPQIDDPGHEYGLLTATGHWEGPVQRDGVSLARFSSSSVLKGMSGAPLLRTADDVVLGVVSGRYRSGDGWLRDSVWISCAEHLAELLSAVPWLRLHDEIVIVDGAAGSILVPARPADMQEPGNSSGAGPGEAALEAATVLRDLDRSCRGPGGLGAVVDRLAVETALAARQDSVWALELRERLRRHGLDARILLPGLPGHDRAVDLWCAPLGDGVVRPREAWERLVQVVGDQIRGALFRHLSAGCRHHLTAALAGSTAAATRRFLGHLEALLPPLLSPSTEIVLVERGSEEVTLAEVPRQSGRTGHQALIGATAQRMCRLPPPDPYFLGRDELLTRICDGLVGNLESRGSAVTYLSGQPGAGTSAVAVEVARRLADRFTGGVYYLDLFGLDPERRRGPRTAVRILSEALGVGLSETATDESAALDLFLTALEGRNVLLLFDNVRDAAHVAPLVRRAASCAVIVTSRDRLQDLADPGLSFGVEPMFRAESVALLRMYAGERGGDGVALDDIAQLCADIPLALRVVGSWLVAAPETDLWHLRDILANEVTRLQYLDTGARPVGAAIALSYALLPDDGRRALRLMTAFPGAAVTARAYAHAAGLDPFKQGLVLHRLADQNLSERTLTVDVQGAKESSFALYELIRLFARERRDSQEDPEVLRAFQERAAWFLRDRLREITDLSPEAEFSGELDPEIFHAAEELAERLALMPTATDLALDLWLLYSARKEIDGIARMCQIRIRLHLRNGEPERAVTACHDTAEQLEKMGSPGLAADSYREALQISSAYRLPVPEARTHFKLSILLGRQGESSQALDHGRTAADLFSELGLHPDALSAMLNNVHLCGRLNEQADRLFWCEQALASPSIHLDQDKLSLAKYEAGRSHLALGELEIALPLIREAGEIDARIEAWSNAGITTTTLANVLIDLGRREEAFEALSRAVEHHSRHERTERLVAVLIKLSSWQVQADDYADASATLARAVQAVADLQNSDVAAPLRRETQIRALLLRELLGQDDSGGSSAPVLPNDDAAEDTNEELENALELVTRWKRGRVSGDEARHLLRELLSRPSLTYQPDEPLWFYENLAPEHERQAELGS
ncbi:S1 family peptidase [Nonomuraea jiangxiensis]|uniref:NB-ARC domain-containing protein n=1 Tax=Nonomuraea jiangxiensis TaxID=633440 RepID=A0A1G9Q6Q6_9ACTN|nr:serine protease [Nonomuraea jiangxiensis]SDM06167.1 NB-ARC domain-containing protein [Nonomuraea jiangxiensis]